MSETLQFLPGPERLLAPAGEDYMKNQLALDKLQRVRWIMELGPWELMATFTFRWEASLWSAVRVYKKTMQKRLPGVSYVAAFERNKSREGYHIHALWGDCKNLYRKEEWNHWFTRYGRALIEPVKDERDASGYAAKYLTKEDGHFEVQVRSHRMAKLQGWDFKLR